MSIEIPNYSLLKKLGAGAFAEVWLAEHKHNRRKAAIKILKESVEVGSDAEKLFLREGEVLASFDHPNIVRIFDNAKQGDHAYLVMEFLAGGSLQERMSQRGLEVGEAIGFIVQIAGALDAAHEREIIHRDLKPANIMLRNDTTPVLTDFGASRLLKRSTIFGRDGGVIGTPQYMSPEQIRGEPLDGRSDLYALGVLFQELLTGKVPFEGTVTEVVTMHLAATPARLPAEQAVLQPILDRLLAKDRTQRFNSGTELCDELRRCFLDEEALRRLVVVTPAGAWSSQLKALGFQLDTQRRSEVRIAQGLALQGGAVAPPPPPIPQPPTPAAVTSTAPAMPATLSQPLQPPPPAVPMPALSAAMPAPGLIGAPADGLRTLMRVMSFGVAGLILLMLAAFGGNAQNQAIGLLIMLFAVLTVFQWAVARLARREGRPVLMVFAWICFAPVVVSLLFTLLLAEGKLAQMADNSALVVLPIAWIAGMLTALTVLTISKRLFGIIAWVVILLLSGVVGDEAEEQQVIQTATVLMYVLVCVVWILLGVYADLRRSAPVAR